MVHKSEIFFWILIGIIVSIAAGSIFASPVFILAGILFLIGFFGIWWWIDKNKFSLIFVVFLAGASLGIFRWEIVREKSANLILPINQKVEFVGEVAEPPVIGKNPVKIVLTVEQVNGLALEKPVKILITERKAGNYELGDIIRGSGEFKKPGMINNFNYAAFLSRQDIYYLSDNPKLELTGEAQGNAIEKYLFKLRNNFENSLAQALPEQEASFASGLILGKVAKFSPDFTTALQKTSTNHLVAIDGYKLTIIAAAVMAMLAALAISPAISFWMTVLIIILFTFMVGAPASAVRAAIMAILMLVAKKTGRMASSKTVIALAAAAMLWVNPKLLGWDLGFQLSFLAIIGIIYLEPILADKIKNWPNLLGLKNVLTLTTAAQVMVMPWILYNFGTLSVVGLPAHIFLMPVMPLAMFWSFAIGALGSVNQFAANIFAPGAGIFLGYMTWTINFFASFRFSALQFNDVNLWPVLAMYSALAMFYIKNYKKPSED